jgi:hypothetical protein
MIGVSLGMSVLAKMPRLWMEDERTVQQRFLEAWGMGFDGGAPERQRMKCAGVENCQPIPKV